MRCRPRHCARRRHERTHRARCIRDPSVAGGLRSDLRRGPASGVSGTAERRGARAGAQILFRQGSPSLPGDARSGENGIVALRADRSTGLGVREKRLRPPACAESAGRGHASDVQPLAHPQHDRTRRDRGPGAGRGRRERPFAQRIDGRGGSLLLAPGSRRTREYAVAPAAASLLRILDVQGSLYQGARHGPAAAARQIQLRLSGRQPCADRHRS